MAKLVFGTGSTRVEMDSHLEESIRRAISQSAPTLIPTIEREIEQIRADAEKAWPVKSGNSRDSLVSYISVERDSIRGVVANDARDANGRPYAYMIRSPKIGKTKGGRPKSPWQELVRKPFLTRARKLAKELAAEIRALVAGG